MPSAIPRIRRPLPRPIPAVTRYSPWSPAPSRFSGRGGGGHIIVVSSMTRFDRPRRPPRTWRERGGARAVQAILSRSKTPKRGTRLPADRLRLISSRSSRNERCAPLSAARQQVRTTPRKRNAWRPHGLANEKLQSSPKRELRRPASGGARDRAVGPRKTLMDRIRAWATKCKTRSAGGGG